MRSDGLLALVAVAVLAGCGQSARTVPFGEDVDGDLAAIRVAQGPPLYFAGERFAGLPLTHVESDRPGHGLFVYGTCKIPTGIDPGGCSPPVQIQIFPFDPNRWRLAVGCRRLPSLRGVRTLRHDGLVLLTRSTVVKIYARNAAEGRRVAGVLRAVANGPGVNDPLPPPRRRVLALADSVCPR
jgi:hypothetical protein